MAAPFELVGILMITLAQFTKNVLLKVEQMMQQCSQHAGYIQAS